METTPREPTPDRMSTPQAAVTTDSSDLGSGTLPPEAYNPTIYRFNHATPNSAPYYQPNNIMDHLTIVEHQTTSTPPVNHDQNYIKVFTALIILLSQQQTTPINHLNYSMPVYCLPADPRMPLYNSTLLNIHFTESVNFYYYHVTSLHVTTNPNTLVVIQLLLKQELLLRYLTSGQLVNFSRDYVSYMLSVTGNHYLPTLQVSQHLFKVDYNMEQFTATYSLSNNYIGITTCHYFFLSYSTTLNIPTNYMTFSTRPSTPSSTRALPTTASHYSQ